MSKSKTTVEAGPEAITEPEPELVLAPAVPTPDEPAAVVAPDTEAADTDTDSPAAPDPEPATPDASATEVPAAEVPATEPTATLAATDTDAAEAGAGAVDGAATDSTAADGAVATSVDAEVSDPEAIGAQIARAEIARAATAEPAVTKKGATRKGAPKKGVTKPVAPAEVTAEPTTADTKDGAESKEKVAAVSLGQGGGFRFGHLLRAEYLKVSTTNVWWLLVLFTTITTGLALTVNILTFHFSAKDHPTDGSVFNQVNGAANIFTSGQFFGALFALLLAILTITNEYHHQTVTTTFLATPHRSSVILAKFVVSMVAAAGFWVFTTVLDLITGAIYFSADGYANHLGSGTVIKAMLLSLLVFALWAVFGVGLGVLIRSQIGATVTAAMLYTVGLYLAIGIFGLIHAYLIKQDWSLSAMVIVPAVAAQIAISPTKIFPQSPHQWVGILVMVGYALLFGAIGIYYTRKRDIS